MTANRVPEAFDPEFLAMLVCPENKEPLHLASLALIDRANTLIAEGKVTSANGVIVNEKIEHGLVRRDLTRLYPVYDGIVTLLVDEAIPLSPELADLARAGA